MDTFIVYEVDTGRIVAVDKTLTQAENIAGALRVYGRMNISTQRTRDYEGGNVHEHFVKLDEI